MSKNYVTSFRGDKYFTPTGKMTVKQEPVTPIEEDFGEHNHLDDWTNAEYGGIRKSLSMNDIASVTADIKKLGCHHHSQDSRQRRTSSITELTKSRCMPMAEAIYHYHRDTPPRFHSCRPQVFRPIGPAGPSGLTVPQSPMLRCKSRTRPVHCMSQKEKEEKEAEEIKKFKIKANPIPKSVLEGSRNLPDIPKKCPTIPEPFNLTAVSKKVNQSSIPVQTFKARPAPKHILEKPQVYSKQSIHITKPVSPKFHYKPQCCYESEKNIRDGAAIQQKSSEKLPRSGPLQPEPFSFEKRDEEIKRRRQERIQKLVEEERKLASQFKAQPLPGAIKKRMLTITAKCGSSTNSSENKENCHKFEAKPPVVLYKEPFKPVLKPVQLVKPTQFHLATEKRAAEREIFDKNLKTKEEELELIKKRKEKEMIEIEEKAKTELRAKLVHHAKPVPVLNQPFVPERSGAALTVPETPKFIRRLRKD